VLGRRGQVVQRVAVDRLPFFIGRGYDNALIVDDRTVSPRHAVVRREADGALVLVDLDSDNGLRLVGSRERVDRVVLDGGAEVRLGGAVLRFRALDHPVAPTVRLTRRHPVLHWASTHWSAVLAGGLAVLGFSFWVQWRAAFQELELASLAQGKLNELLLLALWAGAWALCGRLLVHAARFVGHWAAACTYSVAGTVVDVVLSYGRFLFAPIVALQRAEAALEALLVAGLLWLHLTLATVLRARRRLLVAVVAASLWFAYQELGLRQDDTDWVQTLPYWSRLQPVPADWLSVESADTFFEDARGMRADLEELARELAEAQASKEVARSR
jgi:pSer/pThr/pTyr-binding forkhead associated (FHA) protein